MTHTRISGPMELLGAHPGISVIDPSSVLTRLWYFDGKFLRAEGFRLDQEYVRSLVALSNQAVGYGIVHGFDVRRRGGDAVRVDGGVALAPSGRVIHLPGEIDLSVAELIERSTGEFDPGVAVTPRTAEFGPCPPERPDAPVTGVPPRALYVLTVAAAEALCGDEERFGQLCEDACAKETDRSLAVEGARFRVRELRLSLPVSARVPFDRTHIRSRVATAYFDSEQRATPSMISGSGLRSGVWCAGAEGVGGEEVPLAVFERSGKTTTWLDMWVARRELVETTPHRYWGGASRCGLSTSFSLSSYSSSANSWTGRTERAVPASTIRVRRRVRCSLRPTMCSLPLSRATRRPPRWWNCASGSPVRCRVQSAP